MTTTAKPDPAPLVCVVVPTIAGREVMLGKTLDAMKASKGEIEVRTIVVKGAPTIGQAWQAGREAAHEDGADYVMLAADDVEPAPWALNSALMATKQGVYPSARILNPDGTLHSCGSLGSGMLLPEVEDGTPAGSCGFPFFAASVLDSIPAIPQIHYYADDWLGYMARLRGMRARVIRAYELRHLEGVVGRNRMQARAMNDRAIAVQSMAAAVQPGIELAPKGGAS